MTKSELLKPLSISLFFIFIAVHTKKCVQLKGIHGHTMNEIHPGLKKTLFYSATVDLYKVPLILSWPVLIIPCWCSSSYCHHVSALELETRKIHLIYFDGF